MQLPGFAVCVRLAAPSCTMWGRARCRSEVSLSLAAAVVCKFEFLAEILGAAFTSDGRWQAARNPAFLRQ